MRDDGELLFERLTPRPAPPALRERVLGAVAQELSSGSGPAWERRCGGLVAAAVLLGAMLNIWAVGTSERRLANLAGPRPVPQQVAEVVEIVDSVAGRETGKWVQQRLSNAWLARPAPAPLGMAGLQRLINDLEITGKVQPREKVQEVPETRPDRAGRAGRHSFDQQRGSHFSSQHTA